MAVVILTSLALIMSILIVVTSSLFNKKKDKSEEILELLPGFNCGSCGHMGCADMARCILENKEEYKKCKPLRGEKLTKMEEYLKNL